MTKKFLSASFICFLVLCSCSKTPSEDKYFNLTLDANGGVFENYGKTTLTFSVKQGSKFSSVDVPRPTKQNYFFTNWLCNNIPITDDYIFQSDVTFYAVYELNHTFELTLDAGEGCFDDGQGSKVVVLTVESKTHFKDVNLPNVIPPDDSLILDHWTKNGVTVTDFVIEENVSLLANYALPKPINFETDSWETVLHSINEGEEQFKLDYNLNSLDDLIGKKRVIHLNPYSVYAEDYGDFVVRVIDYKKCNSLLLFDFEHCPYIEIGYDTYFWYESNIVERLIFNLLYKMFPSNIFSNLVENEDIIFRKFWNYGSYTYKKYTSKIWYFDSNKNDQNEYRLYVNDPSTLIKGAYRNDTLILEKTDYCTMNLINKYPEYYEYYYMNSEGKEVKQTHTISKYDPTDPNSIKCLISPMFGLGNLLA